MRVLWSIPIDRKDLKRQIGYLISGTGQTNAGGKAKRADGKARHPALFDLPLHALAEIARSSSGIHWLDAGGIFSKSARKKYTTSTDELPGETIGWMHGRVVSQGGSYGASRSRHPGGVNSRLADGSVRAMRMP